LNDELLASKEWLCSRELCMSQAWFTLSSSCQCCEKWWDVCVCTFNVPSRNLLAGTD